MLLKFILFLFINFKFVLSYNQPKVRLEIAPHQSKVNTPERQPFLLTCSGAGQEPTFFDHLKWFDPQKQEISNKNDYHFKNYDLREKKGSILLSFKEPTEALSGNYTCKGLFQNVVELSKSIEVNFYQDITWEDCPSSQALIKGKKNSLIRCKITAKPSADVTWSKDGKELASNKFLRNNNGLTVNGIIDDSLEGKYDIEAHVSETGAIKYTSIMVNIHTEPEILELKPFFEVVENESANLNCKAFGIPAVRYYWFDSNRRNLSTIGGYIVNTDNGDLIINKVNKEEVKGEFTCFVENSAGRSSKSTKIQVLSKPKILFFANVSAVEDLNGFIECTATGNPIPSLSIRKDGELSSITSGGNYMVEEIKMTEYESKIILKILKTQRSDDGLYYCIATNKIEKTDLVGHLQVEYKPDLRKTVKNVKTWGDRQVNLTCIVNSIPNATVSWYFLNNLISNNNYYTIINEDYLSNFKHSYQGINNLIINPRGATSTIYGDYTCRAENKHGYNYTTINLSQAYRPSIQEDPDLTNDSPTSILIKFNNNNFFNGGLPIKKLKVKYRERTQSENMAKIKEFPFDNDYILNGLVPRNFYYLSFSVENDVGSSDWTRDFEKIMPKESVPECPKFTYDINSNCNPNLKPLESDFYDRFDIKWLQPNDNGRPIEIYSLKYYPVERDLNGWSRIESFKEIFSSNNDQLIQRITSLKPNTTYQVELRAKNSEGYSPPSLLVFKTSFSNSAGVQSFQEQISKAFTDFYSMIVIIGIFLIITLFILDVILYVRYDFGFLFCLCHGCSSNNTRSGKKIKNSHSLNTGYAYHRPANDTDHFVIDKTARKEFQAELEYRLRMPKHSAV